MPKQRKVFAMRNFLGLDKENKALKVAPFRASDGYNFQIDSQTLKTREGFVIDSFIESDLASNESVIDWYEYKGATLYVTTAGFYVVFGTSTTNLLTDTTKTVKSTLTGINFTGKKPIFKEEKNALFIFGLGAIYVFSILFTTTAQTVIDKIVIYDLKSKPTNPFSAGSGEQAAAFNYQNYVDLPSPYEPTLFIGDAAFDDVNLLSNVSKYKLFAKDSGDSEYSKYYLPTHYDEEKHGSFNISNNLDIKFYDGVYDDVNVFPIFLGIDTENFTYSSSVHGAVQNSVNIDIDETFYPEEDFEHYHHTQNQADTYIKQRYGLTKEKFFRFKVKGTEQNVFEYLMNYIKNNIDQTTFTNKVFKFDLDYQVTNIEKKETDTTQTIGTETKNDTVEVYVQLRKTDLQEKHLDTSHNQNFQSSLERTELPSSDAYPAYPDDQSGTTATTVELQNPRESDTSDLESFAEQALTDAVETDISTYSGGDIVEYKGKFYFRQTITGQPSYRTLNSNVAEDANQQLPYPDYPSSSTDYDAGGLNIVTLGVISTNVYSYPYDEEQIESDLEDFIQANDSFSDYTTSQQIFVEYRIKGFASLSGSSGINYFSSRIAKIDYVVGASQVVEKRISANIQFKILDTAPNTIGSLYNFKFNASKNWFELELRDYFFDYNLEPSIEVTVNFNQNPDYDLISQSTFGVLFGSEDRLFLAGHPDYPNVDRYNVSNDLLGDNVENQSYELSYFPSKNYRVLGGKGAINGYVEATDTQLYVTKAHYPGDAKLFIRERFLDEKGLAGYKEFKTNILETPINNRCIVRFYNDILMLTKNGLYGVEIASNVLTNERLLKLRSGYVNKHLKSLIATATSSGKDIYIVENNQMMYIFIGLDVFVADSRYISKNENSEIENLSYELIQWKTKEEYSAAKFKDNVLYVIGNNKEVKLKLVEDTDEDYVSDYSSSSMSTANYTLQANDFLFNNNFLQISGGTSAADTFTNFSKSSLFLTETDVATEIFAKRTQDFLVTSYSNGVATLTKQNDSPRFFTTVSPGQTVFFTDDSGTRLSGTFTINTITSTTATINSSVDISSLTTTINNIGVDVSKVNLFPVIALKDGTDYYFKYSRNEYASSFAYDLGGSGTPTQDAIAKFESDDYNKYFEIIFTSSGSKNAIISIREPIVFLWQSSMTDFGNNLMEKTMYRANLYATKQATSNSLLFGYKTMRRYKSIDETNSIKVLDFDVNTSIANQFSLNDIDFNLFSINTFEESGMSFPLKENNFLYIQFLVKASGRVELNAIEAIYKDNRRLKSIG
jgi:hypothetical protein